VPVARPRIEAAALLLYLLFYAFVVLGWAMGAVKAAVPPGQAQELATLALKLLVHVVGPIGLLLLLRAPIRAMFDTGLSRPGFWPTLIVLGAILLGLLAVVSPSLSQIAALGLAPPALALGIVGAFVWIALEAGLCEEFLFRAALQSRLAALLEAPAAAIVVTSLLFALAHAPGLYLRGTPETDGWSTDPLQVAAFTIATLSPISILFGILWARTRSLLLVACSMPRSMCCPSRPNSSKPGVESRTKSLSIDSTARRIVEWGGWVTPSVSPCYRAGTAASVRLSVCGHVKDSPTPAAIGSNRPEGRALLLQTV
jgi:membrane protease YdiL (CAAX protease family)